MRLVQATRFGGPEVLVVSEAPDPVAGPRQVVIEVSVADTLFVETQIRRGLAEDWFTLEPPYVPGGGVAGEVISVGEGVDAGWMGTHVVTHTGITGGYTEQILAPIERLIAVPEGMDLREAAALLHDGQTALGLFENAGIREGEWVLVIAAGGGLGILLVQLAHTAGARVIGTACGKRKLDLARDLGAEIVIDYSEPDWAKHVREATGGKGADVVFDGAGGEIGRAAFEVTAGGGRFSAHGAPSGGAAQIDSQEAQERRITVRGIEQVQFSPAASKRLTERALSEAVAGRIKPVIGQSFPLEGAAEAHAAIESRDTVGKTLLVARLPAPFTQAELGYLESQTLGRLATVQPNGTLQVSPVGFHYNPETATVDIRGYNMAASRKYRNVADNGRAAFVVDDIASRKPWRVRCLEIRGRAEAIETSDGAIIRVYPGRIIGFGIDNPDQDVHELTGNIRDATEPPDHDARD